MNVGTHMARCVDVWISFLGLTLVARNSTICRGLFQNIPWICIQIMCLSNVILKSTTSYSKNINPQKLMFGILSMTLGKLRALWGSFPDPEASFGGIPNWREHQRWAGNMWMVKILSTPSPGSPNTKLFPLVARNPLYGSSQRLFFVWSWSSRASILLFANDEEWFVRCFFEDLEIFLHPYSGQSTPMTFDKFLFPFPRPLWLFHFHRQPAWKTPQIFRAENCGCKIAVNADDMFLHFKDLVDERTGTENPPRVPASFWSSWNPITRSLGSRNLAKFGQQRVFFNKNDAPWKQDFLLLLS